MDNSNRSAESIFYAALDQTEEQRTAFISDACGSDDSLKQEILRLLESHQRNETDKFILDRGICAAETDPHAAMAESEGDSIGRYRLLELIGEGGMGRVYMAEQNEGVRRRVALKIIKLGMDTRQVIARFEAERQALALFDHPSITRVLDAGTTETGRPYFVMELVRGTCITDYVNSNKVPLAERLRLFIEVCRAVQHAHLKGVIHRDLKPSNILVTQFDGIPVPKVIDFGIAKAIGHVTLTDKTLFTRYASMVGTPQYMSPEQAEMTGLDIDTRSDIYSLGVILYELITGSTPLESNQLKLLNPLALYETLRDANIETPSTRAKRIQESTLGQNDSAETVSRTVAPAKAISPERIKGELDWIVMKAISRDRRLRYESCSDLAADIERHLSGEPVLAAPPSKYYAMQTLLRKHRSVVLTSLVVGLLLLSSTLMSGFLAIKNHRTSNQLAKSNERLEKTISDLTDARELLQRESENKRYRSAIKLALNEFEIELLKESEKTFRTKLASHLQVQKDGDDADAAPEELFGVVTSFAFPTPASAVSSLLDLSESKLLENAVAPIREIIEERRNAEASFTTEFFNTEDAPIPLNEYTIHAIQPDDPGNVAQTTFIGENLVDIPSEAPVDIVNFPFEVEFEDILSRVQPKFYRILLHQYYMEFGENDPRVAPALNILANHLMDEGNLNEAESNLRHSILLANKEDKAIAESLLRKLKRSRVAK